MAKIEIGEIIAKMDKLNSSYASWWLCWRLLREWLDDKDDPGNPSPHAPDGKTPILIRCKECLQDYWSDYKCPCRRSG